MPTIEAVDAGGDQCQGDSKSSPQPRVEEPKEETSAKDQDDVVIDDDDSDDDDCDDDFGFDDADVFGGSLFDMLGGVTGKRKKSKKGSRSSLFDGFMEGFEFPDALFEGREGGVGSKRKKGNFESYSYSSSVSVGPDGKQHVREQTSQTRSAGGRLSETQKTLRDSDDGLEKMTLERTIGGKKRTVEKKRVNGGDVETKEKLVGITEEEKEEFDKRFCDEAKKTFVSGRLLDEKSAKEPSKKKQKLLPAPPTSPKTTKKSKGTK